MITIGQIHSTRAYKAITELGYVEVKVNEKDSLGEYESDPQLRKIKTVMFGKHMPKEPFRIIVFAFPSENAVLKNKSVRGNEMMLDHFLKRKVIIIEYTDREKVEICQIGKVQSSHSSTYEETQIHYISFDDTKDQIEREKTSTFESVNTVAKWENVLETVVEHLKLWEDSYYANAGLALLDKKEQYENRGKLISKKFGF